MIFVWASSVIVKTSPMVRLQLYPAPSTQHTRMVSQTHGQCLSLKQNKGFKFKVIENQIIKELTCNMNICDGVKCWPLPGSSLYYVGLPVVRNAQLGMDDGDRVQSAAPTPPQYQHRYTTIDNQLPPY